MTEKISKFIFGVYLLFLVWLILFKLQVNLPRFLALTDVRTLNLVPFARTGGNGQMLLNLLAFVPLGWFLRKVGQLSVGKSLLAILATTLVFETLQYSFAIGASDINDVLMNTLGGLLGIGLYQLLGKRFKGVGFLLELYFFC